MEKYCLDRTRDGKHGEQGKIKKAKGMLKIPRRRVYVSKREGGRERERDREREREKSVLLVYTNWTGSIAIRIKVSIGTVMITKWRDLIFRKLFCHVTKKGRRDFINCDR